MLCHATECGGVPRGGTTKRGPTYSPVVGTMGVTRTPVLIFLAVALLLAPSVPAAPHAPPEESLGASLQLLVNGDANPRTVHAGAIVSFTWLLLDGDGEPFVHHDAAFQVTLDGAVLMETTPASGHDYDGKDTYRVRVPASAAESNLTATVEITPRGSDEPVVERVVLPVEPPAEDTPQVRVSVENAGSTGDLATLEATVDGVEGASTLAWHVQELTTGFDVLHVTTRAQGTHEVRFAFPDTTRYTVQATLLTGPATADATTVQVLEASPPTRPADPPTRRPMENAVEHGTAPADHVLFATYDPYTSIGTHGRIRLGTVLLDEANRTPSEPASVAAELTGPHGRVLLTSEDLHAPGGLLTVTVHRPEVGDHLLRVNLDDGEGSVELPWSVHAPAIATAAGPQFTHLDGPRNVTAGEGGPFAFHVRDAAGVPFMHSEVDLRVVGPDGVPWFTGKLHTHSDGTFPIDLGLLGEGQWRLEASPTALHPSPTPAYYGPTVGSAPVFTVSVSGVPAAVGDVVETLEDQDANVEVPAAPAISAVLALMGVAWIRRRGIA